MTCARGIVGPMKKLLIAGAIVVFVIAWYAVYVLTTLPDVAALNKTNPTVTALMEQRAAERKTKVRPIRSWTSYNRISPHLRHAVLVAEDGAFFQHSGYDVDELKESVKRNWREGRFARGASTITQQLAKNLYLSTSKNPLRKIREFFIARELEEHLSKQRIFEIYLNVIEWSNGVYGIGPAAREYFNKEPSELRPEEAAVLAAMIPSPRSYSASRGMTQYLQKRKNELLSRMRRLGHLNEGEYEDAVEREIEFRR